MLCWQMSLQYLESTQHSSLFWPFSYSDHHDTILWVSTKYSGFRLRKLTYFYY